MLAWTWLGLRSTEIDRELPWRRAHNMVRPQVVLVTVHRERLYGSHIVLRFATSQTHSACSQQPSVGHKIAVCAARESFGYRERPHPGSLGPV